MSMTDFEAQKKVYELLLEADRHLWEAVLEMHDGDAQKLKALAKPLMLLRGELHVEFMRPIYKKYPELAGNLSSDWSEEDKT